MEKAKDKVTIIKLVLRKIDKKTLQIARFFYALKYFFLSFFLTKVKSLAGFKVSFLV